MDTVTSSLKFMPGFSPDEFIGRTYLLPPEPDRQCFRAKIVKILKDQEEDIKQHPDNMQFLISTNDGTRQEITFYSNIIGHIEKDYNKSSDGSDCLYKFCDITAHQV